MKTTVKISILFLLVCVLSTFSTLAAQTTSKTETFKVYGNCEMCKANIEGALKKKDGILKKNWSPDTKLITVTYDPSKITLTQIKQKIGNVGYDTDEIHGDDAAYNKLHACCKYDRKK